MQFFPLQIPDQSDQYIFNQTCVLYNKVNTQTNTH